MSLQRSESTAAQNAGHDAGHDAEQARQATAPEALARLAAATPWLILGYIAALTALRLSLSPFLEIDEAQFVGHVDWRLVYENSHPPLYNWGLRLLLEATGWSWPVSTALMKYGLLGAFYFLTWDAARRLGGASAGLLAVAAAAFLPQIVWMSAHTLAHSIMVLTGAAAMIHAAVVVWRAPSPLAFVWLGLACVLGALAKFNFFLFAIPLLIALAIDPETRARFFERRALLSLGIFALATAPIFAAAARELGASTERMDKLYSGGGDYAWLDLPGIGLDGLVSLAVAGLAWAGPLALIWALAQGLERRLPEASAAPTAPEPFVRALGWAMALGMAAFALVVLAGDMHRVHERYLTPILAGLPIWVALALPLARLRPWVIGLAGAAFAAALIGVFAMVQTQKHRYAIPYADLATEIARAGAPEAPILGRRHSDVANLTLALGWRGSSSPRYAPVESLVLAVWRGDRAKAPKELPLDGFTPVGPPTVVRAPYRNWREDAFALSFQTFARP
ncbi:MAG: glycosyltransferase family 39 protein [Pseudomonadota bacterium]